MNTQALSDYQWKNRLIVILTANASNENVEDQMEEFQNKKAEMEERKLVVFQITPSEYRTLFPEKTAWKEQKDMYVELKKSASTYEVLLIGLDGGVKLRQDETLKSELLFKEIDSMPMRQAEMQRD